MKLDRLDALLVVVITALAALHVLATFDFAVVPFEDAAILLRFADHMAQGHGIVWNVGDPPLDGATDFLFLVSLGVLGMIGIDIPSGVHVIGIGSHLLACAFLYFAIRRLHGAPRWTGVVSALYLAVGPGLRQIEGGFGAAYFALFGALCWYLAYRVFLARDTRITAPAFAVCSLLLGLIRPEGVFLSAFMVGALLVTCGFARCRRLLLHYVLIFGGLGAAYFLWRWSYFGHPLPNPFYVKGGGSLYPFSLVDSSKNVVKLCAPFLPLVVLAAAIASARLLRSPLRRRYLALFAGVAAVVWGFGALTALEGGDKVDGSRATGVEWCAALGAAWLFGPLLMAALWTRLGARARDGSATRASEEAIFTLLPVFAFTFLWILLSAIMNYFERFQYAVLPLVLIAWPALLQGLVRTGCLPSLAHRPLARVVLPAAFGVLAVAYAWSRWPPIAVQPDGTYRVARMLAEYGGPERRMIVTNAGHLPFYSGWSAMDAWGLTDQNIAHHGLTEEYVAAFHPDVIQFDAMFSPKTSHVRPEFAGWEWYRATVLLKQYAERHGYVLAAAFGLTPDKSHHYYVRADWPPRAEVVARLRSMEYLWFKDPSDPRPEPIATNYAVN